ncbi:MAG: hypothetical protein MUF00_02380 [Gemmatimonadaceae bacterium]|jgi:hypothetical protein|nr:hypothetical protein [Gemmatimonadaceae bacterium]
MEPTLRVLLEPDHGRWWVVFEVTFPASADRDETVVRRPIASYATQKAARIAARNMRRGADRSDTPPTFDA